MRVKTRVVPGAYVGRDWEVVGPLGQRVFPAPADSVTKKSMSTGLDVVLGCSLAEAKAFVAGYRAASAAHTAPGTGAPLPVSSETEEL